MAAPFTRLTLGRSESSMAPRPTPIRPESRVAQRSDGAVEV